MGARKGQNNFQKIQSTRVTNGKLLITYTLNSVKRGLVFRDLNALIVYVADRTKMHRTTIARNSEYLQLILNHFASQSGAVDLISDTQANAANLRAKLFACRTRATNLEIENQRLKRAFGLACTESDGVTRQSADNRSAPDENLISELSFSNTAMALLALLERLNEKELGVALDLSKKQIIDLAEVGNRRIIAGPQRTRWFFEWLSMSDPVFEKTISLLSSKTA